MSLRPGHASLPTGPQPRALSRPPRQIPRRKQSLKQQGYLSGASRFPQSTSHAVSNLASQHLSGEQSQPAVTPRRPPRSAGAEAPASPCNPPPGGEEKGFGGNRRTGCSEANCWEHLDVTAWHSRQGLPLRARSPAATPGLSPLCPSSAWAQGSSPSAPRLALCGCCPGRC